MADEQAMTIAREKKSLRQTIKARAAALSPDAVRRSDAAICRVLLALPELTAASTIFSFHPVGPEPGILPVLETLLAQGKTLALPRCTAPGVMEARQIMSLSGPAGPIPGRYGIPEPREDSPLIPWDAFSFAILPCVAADRLGNRLGHGGGYYDRFLAQAPCKMISAVVCRAALMPDSIPTLPHDLPADLVVTENGVWHHGRLAPASL